MAKARDHRPKGSHQDGDGPEGNEQGDGEGPDGNEQGDGEGPGGDGEGPDGNGEEFDEPEVHREIERSRFYGGLQATPEMYARAREQWHRLPGSLVRSSMDPVVSDAASCEQNPTLQVEQEEKRERR